jgi:hypothetical protein
VKWIFLIDCCKHKGFSDRWIVWIKEAVTKGTLSVKINDTVGPYFGSFKCVRQGDHFALFLFNMAANSLCKMIVNAQRSSSIKGLAVLQYAHDTVLLIQHDVEGARNLKLLLYIFEIMFGLKINFEKVKLC